MLLLGSVQNKSRAYLSYGLPNLFFHYKKESQIIFYKYISEGGGGGVSGIES